MSQEVPSLRCMRENKRDKETKSSANLVGGTRERCGNSQM